VNAGPPLIFETLPTVFSNMPGGRIWGSLFFLFLSFAALSTVFAVFENINASFIDLTGVSKKKASIINGIAMFILSVPCVLGFNLWSAFQPLKAGNTFMDLEDIIVSNILLPVGSLIFVLFCTNKRGWGFKNFMDEANTGKGYKVKKWMSFYLTYILPVIIAALFVIGIVNYFK
jgi:NSS family neurotransmitter:Na+ symporter